MRGGADEAGKGSAGQEREQLKDGLVIEHVLNAQPRMMDGVSLAQLIILSSRRFAT